MKNLFNDISQSEKNRILEMHGVKPVISESQQLISKLKSITKEQWEVAAQGCWDKKRFPKLISTLNSLMDAYKWSVPATVCFAVGYLLVISGGLASFALAILIGSVGSAVFTNEVLKSFTKVFKQMGDKLISELKGFYNCLRQKYDSFSWLPPL